MKSNILKNTLTNYLTAAVRILGAIFVTRWTVSYLGVEYYGLWALLWSLFAYAILLDFGFGISAQKYTSAEIFKTDIAKYNRIISTVFSFHLLMLLIIALGTILGTVFLADIIRVHNPEQLAYCRKAFLIFGLGTAFIFPFGMFSEILVGLQKLYVRNYIQTCEKIVEFVGTGIVFLAGGGLITLVIFMITTSFLANVAIAICAFKSISGFKITYRLDWATCREIAGFSGFVYLMSVSRLILNRSNRLLVSIFCGLEDMGTYHLASRLPEYCLMAAGQYQENVRPMASNLYSRKEFEKLSFFIFHSLKWNVFISIVLMMPCFLYAGDLIKLLFNISDPNVTYMCRLVVVAMFCLVSCRRIPEVYLQMTDRHKLTGYVTMAEAFCNVMSNIIFLPKYGVTVVIWNSIIFRLIFTFIFLFPRMIKSLNFTWRNLMMQVYIIPFALCVPPILAALAIDRLEGAIGWFLTMSIGGCTCAIIFVVLAYFLMLGKTERQMFKEKFGKIFSKISPKRA